MAQSQTRELTQALEGVLESVSLVFDALLRPYETLAATDGRSVLGSPLRVPPFVRSVALREAADQIEARGRSAWSLHQVETRENQLGAFLSDYRKGRYRATPVGEWVGMVSRFRDGVLADLHTAMQAPRGWDRLHLGQPPAVGTHHDADLLGPKDVAAELRIAERTARRRIQEGKLGPWRKRGSRWVITRGAFHRYWERLIEDDDVPRPGSPGDASTPDELDHVHLEGG